MAVDCFAELGIERRLTWTAEELRDRYDARCREVHPDSGGGAAEFQVLREAYGQLLGLGSRLRHWLDLGGVPRDGGGLSPEISEWFGRLGPLVQGAQELVKRQAAARSALARSMVEREAWALMPELERARSETQALIDGAVSRFPEFDKLGVEGCRDEAAEVASRLQFLEKWERELRSAWSALGCW